MALRAENEALLAAAHRVCSLNQALHATRREGERLARARDDALVGDETSVKSIQAQYPEAHLSIVYDDEAFTPEFFGILYPKDTGAELKSKIDKALKDMIADGTYGKIYEKWFKTKVDEETLGKLGKR